MQLSSSDLQWGKLIIASIENGNLTHPFMKDDSTEYIMRYNEMIYPMEKLSFFIQEQKINLRESGIKWSKYK